MSALTPQPILTSGMKPTYSAAAGGGDTIPQESKARRFAFVKNGGGGSITVTVAKQATSLPVSGYGSVPTSDLSVAIPAGEERMIGPFSDVYKDASGNINLAYSGVTTVTVAAIELPSL